MHCFVLNLNIIFIEIQVTIVEKLIEHGKKACCVRAVIVTKQYFTPYVKIYITHIIMPSSF